MKLKSLYSRIALTFALLILLFGGLCGGLDYFSAKQHQQEIVQRLSADLAKHIAEKWPLAKSDNLDNTAVSELFNMLMIVNPGIEVYLLDTEGKIKAHQAPPGRLLTQRVNLAPIQAFLQGKPLPLLGDNPRNLEQGSIFSATALAYENKKVGYLYIVLTGDDYLALATNIWQSHVFRSVLWTGLGALVLTLIAGLGLFSVITRRLNALTETVTAFEQTNFVGGLQVPLEIKQSEDEIGQLAHTFEGMAARMSHQLLQIQTQDEMRREMIANLSHDLQTPLTSMQGYLETLQRKSDSLSLPDQQRYLEVAVKQSRKVNQLAAQLFELAKLECQEIKPNFEPIYIQELLQDIKQKFELAAQEKQVTLIAAFDKKLPQVYADIGLIERVLTNLLDNALRHIHEHGKINLELLQETNTTITVRITDNGEGIAKEDLAGLFERHSPLRQSSTKSHGGSGLGLLIAKRILELHGNKVEVSSQSGQGAVFWFSLPICA